MVQARTQVHDAGVFTPLAQRSAVIAGREPLPDGAVLDVGCGTGYYTAAVLDAPRGGSGWGSTCRRRLSSAPRGPTPGLRRPSATPGHPSP